jgi:hypothetical protein
MRPLRANDGNRGSFHFRSRRYIQQLQFLVKVEYKKKQNDMIIGIVFKRLE